jgi:hypothetical protein
VYIQGLVYTGFWCIFRVWFIHDSGVYSGFGLYMILVYIQGLVYTGFGLDRILVYIQGLVYTGFWCIFRVWLRHVSL